MTQQSISGQGNIRNRQENNAVFHESRDSSMDKHLPRRTFFSKYKWYMLSIAAFIVFLIYVLTTISGGRKLNIDKEKIVIDNVKEDKFLDYVDAEGIVQPILTIKINSTEGGVVSKIVAEEGVTLKKGDIILQLTNPELMQQISNEQDEWERQRMLYEEDKIEAEQKSLILKQQMLQTDYELNRLKKDYALSEEEFRMGVKSKAQLDVQKEEFDYKTKNTVLQMKNLKQDSIASVLKKKLLETNLQLAHKKNSQTQLRAENLIVRAPVDGQLSFLNVTLGQRVSMSEGVGEIKVMDNFKIHSQLSEYYVDRVTVGLPASVTYQNKKYPLRVSKVVPEVKDRQFDVDFVFTGEKPDNVRIGKSYRVQVELGQPETTIVIPRGDFFQTTGGQWIFKLNKAGNKAIKTPISVGRQNPVQYEIVKGLKTGDRVVTSGYINFGEAEELIIK